MFDKENTKDDDQQDSRVPIGVFAQDLHGFEPVIEYIQRIYNVPAKEFETDSLKLTDEERRKRLGARIRLMRIGAQLKQKDLAEKLGVTKQTVTAYESGRAEPSLKNLIALSRILGMPVGWLLGEEPAPK